MIQRSGLIAFFSALLASAHAQADDRTGNFPTDILAVGNSYALAGTSIFSERSDYLRINKRSKMIPGSYDSHVTTGVMAVRHGLFENTDVTVSLPYSPVYDFTTASAGSDPQTTTSQRGWGSPSVTVAYGLVAGATRPYSVTASLSAVADITDNSTGSMTPSLKFGYKLTDTSRLYATMEVYYPTKAHATTQEDARFGGQYDIGPSLTLDLSAQQTRYNSNSLYNSYFKTAAVIELYYKVSENFVVSPSFSNEWRSDKTRSTDIAVYKATSDIRTYSFSAKYLF